MIDYAAFIQRCDTDLRSGRSGKAIEGLRRLSIPKVPREHRMALANLRRSGLWMVGLHLLVHIVRDEKELDDPATAGEKAEYAVLLMKGGAVLEAMEILNGVADADVPEAPMYRAFCEMALWNYDAAIPHLQLYLKRHPRDYQSLIARVNLASSLVWLGQTDRAKHFLEALISEAEATNSLRLKANCLELRGQVHLQTGDLTACSADLEDARKILDAQNIDRLLVRKWESALAAIQSGSIDPLVDFRQEALQKQQWESVRDCDLHILKLKFDPGLFRKLVCGTPYESYRRKACALLGEKMPGGVYEFGAGGPVLDMRTGQSTNGADIKVGQKVHQMLTVLLHDFYKPVSLGAIHASLFAGEHFNIYSSPGRIHQILSRTRQYFSDHGYPAEVQALDSGYFLRLHGPMCIRLPVERALKAGPQAQIEKLRELLLLENREREEFNSRQVSRILEISEPSARRLLRWAVAESRLSLKGAGPSTKYKLAS